MATLNQVVAKNKLLCLKDITVNILCNITYIHLNYKQVQAEQYSSPWVFYI